MTTELFRAVRYRNYAEELRVIAADHKDADNRQILVRIADDYERMAAELEAIAAARGASIDRQPSQLAAEYRHSAGQRGAAASVERRPVAARRTGDG